MPNRRPFTLRWTRGAARHPRFSLVLTCSPQRDSKPKGGKAASKLRPSSPDPLLKRQFQCHLHNARVTSRRHVTEGTGINVARRSHKLRMVKGIEELGAIFEINSFLESHRLVKRQVEVVDPRPIEEAARGVTRYANDFRRKGASTEVLMGGARSRVKLLDRLVVVVWIVKAATATQRAIVSFAHEDGDARCEAGDTRERPPSEQCLTQAG